MVRYGIITKIFHTYHITFMCYSGRELHLKTLGLVFSPLYPLVFLLFLWMFLYFLFSERSSARGARMQARAEAQARMRARAQETWQEGRCRTRAAGQKTGIGPLSPYAWHVKIITGRGGGGGGGWCRRCALCRPGR